MQVRQTDGRLYAYGMQDAQLSEVNRTYYQVCFILFYFDFLTIAVKILDSVAHEKEKAMQGVKSVSKPQPGYDRDYFIFYFSFF